MDFTFSEDQCLFQNSLANFLQREVTPDFIRQCWELRSRRSDELWSQLVGLGIPSVLIPDCYGGLGMNELDFVLLATECGRVALPDPLVDVAMVVVPLLTDLVKEDERCGELLEKLASGRSLVSACMHDGGLVVDAHTADWFLLSHGDEVHLVHADDVSMSLRDSVDPSRRLFSLGWNPTTNSRLASGDRGRLLQAEAINRGALGAAAQLIGLAEAMVEMTVQYTTDRTQFGRPIGSNQALKHHMADCAVRIEFAKPVVARAAYVLAHKEALPDVPVSHAKLSAGSSAALAAENSIQCHGAMGYTWECDLHIFMKRAWSLEKSWGDSGFHQNRVLDQLKERKLPLAASDTFVMS